MPNDFPALKYLTSYRKNKKVEHTLKTDYRYYSPRYGKHITCKYGMNSDGATGKIFGYEVPDLASWSWWVHDECCNTGCFDDGTPMTNWQASMILRDILKSEGRAIRSKIWMIATWVGGGGAARKNGMF